MISYNQQLLMVKKKKTKINSKFKLELVITSYLEFVVKML